MQTIFDISLPIYNRMWAYRPELNNTVQLLSSTQKGDASTIYQFNLFSNTGTYIETSQHKLANNILLDDLPLDTFYRKVKVVIVDEQKIISKSHLIERLNENKLLLSKGDALIIANGYGINHRKENYLSNSPSFSEELTEWLANLQLDLLGVDTPIIDNVENPYQPVVKLFEANADMLLLAPLRIDTTEIITGEYILSCFPLKIESTAVSLCRAILIK